MQRHQAGEFHCNVALIASNHESARPLAEFYNIPFHYLPVTRETKSQVEAHQLDLLREHDVDLIVLARYMQILSPTFVDAYPRRIINVHHLFLPAFTGARAIPRGLSRAGSSSSARLAIT